MQGLLRRRGIPLALYTDRHAVFKHSRNTSPMARPPSSDRPRQNWVSRRFSPCHLRQRKGGTYRGNLSGPADHGLRLAGATTMEQRRLYSSNSCPASIGVSRFPPQVSSSRIPTLAVRSASGAGPVFQAQRRVARDNTVKFQRHPLQLLPGRRRRSYAGATVLVLQGLDGRLSLQHEGRSRCRPRGAAKSRNLAKRHYAFLR